MCRLRIESHFYYAKRGGNWTTSPMYDRRWWRYKIRCEDLTVYTRSGFATYDRAVTSARRQFPKVSFAIHGPHHEPEPVAVPVCVHTEGTEGNSE